MYLNRLFRNSFSIKLLVLPALALLLSACDDSHDNGHYDSGHYHDPGYRYDDHHGGYVDYSQPLELYLLELIDGAGFGSEGIYGPFTPEIIVSPDAKNDESIFDIRWEVSGSEHYKARIFVNDKPSLNNSIKLASQECELGEICDTAGVALCTYDENYLGCSTSAFIDEQVFIGDLLVEYPQRLYIVVETCDLDWGECDVAHQAFEVY